VTELLHTAPLIVRRNGEQTDDSPAGRSYELFGPHWRLLGNAREEQRGGRRRLTPWGGQGRCLPVFDAYDRPLMGLQAGSGKRADTAQASWADGTPLGVIRRTGEGAEFDLVDSHGRALGRLDLRPAGAEAAGGGRGPAAMERSHHPVIDPSGAEVATLIREYLPNTPGRYPPHLLTFTLRPHRETSAPRWSSLRRFSPLGKCNSTNIHSRNRLWSRRMPFSRV
jgi:hypothetical protein